MWREVIFALSLILYFYLEQSNKIGITVAVGNASVTLWNSNTTGRILVVLLLAGHVGSNYFDIEHLPAITFIALAIIPFLFNESPPRHTNRKNIQEVTPKMEFKVPKSRESIAEHIEKQTSVSKIFEPVDEVKNALLYSPTDSLRGDTESSLSPNYNTPKKELTVPSTTNSNGISPNYTEPEVVQSAIKRQREKEATRRREAAERALASRK